MPQRPPALRRHMSLLTAVIHHKLGHHPRSHIMSSAQRLIVHLVRLHRHRKVILVQRGRRWRVEQRVDVPHRLVGAGPLLQIDTRRVGYRCVHCRACAVCLGQGRRAKRGQGSGAVMLGRRTIRHRRAPPGRSQRISGRRHGGTRCRRHGSLCHRRRWIGLVDRRHGTSPMLQRGKRDKMLVCSRTQLASVSAARRVHAPGVLALAGDSRQARHRRPRVKGAIQPRLGRSRRCLRSSSRRGMSLGRVVGQAILWTPLPRWPKTARCIGNGR